MNKTLIKEKMAMNDVYVSDIAKKFRCTTANVHQLFNHTPTKTGKPSLIRKYIANSIGMSYEEVWG